MPTIWVTLILLIQKSCDSRSRFNVVLVTCSMDMYIPTLFHFRWYGRYVKLVGGFKSSLFSTLLGEIIQFDLRIFFKWVGSTQPPTIGKGFSSKQPDFCGYLRLAGGISYMVQGVGHPRSIPIPYEDKSLFSSET